MAQHAAGRATSLAYSLSKYDARLQETRVLSTDLGKADCLSTLVKVAHMKSEPLQKPKPKQQLARSARLRGKRLTWRTGFGSRSFQVSSDLRWRPLHSQRSRVSAKTCSRNTKAAGQHAEPASW